MVELVFLALAVAIGGAWMVQDGIASILYYLHDDKQKWHFDHAVRLMRIAWGLGFIVIAILQMRIVLG